MDAILLIGGVAISLAGLVLTGFAIFKPGTAGTALITSGTIALVGGLILIGLAAILWQLLRIAQALGAVSSLGKPEEVAPTPMPAAAEADMPPTVVEMPVAEKDVRLAEPSPRPVERKPPPAAPPAPAPEPRIAPPQAPRDLPASWLASDPAGKERRPRREPDRPIEDAPKPHPADGPDQSSAAASTATDKKKGMPAREDATMPDAPDPAFLRPPAQRTRSLLDRLWTGDRAADTSPPVEIEVPKPPPPPDSAPSIEDMISQKIFKSGVIEGMPYTLYIDGSIEAELPQGTVRFASLDELRAHLAKRNR